MAPSLYSRIYSRLSDLIPLFSSSSQDGAMFAAPRQKDGMALFCVITVAGEGKAKVEIAHDKANGGEDISSPWMIFEVDHTSATAELVGFTDETAYYKKASAAGHVDSQRTPLNVYAVNWLSCFINLHFQFAHAPHPSFAAAAPADALYAN